MRSRRGPLAFLVGLAMALVVAIAHGATARAQQGESAYGSNYITFTGQDPFALSLENVTWDGTLQYATADPDSPGSWISVGSGSIPSSNTEPYVLYLRGSGNNYVRTKGINVGLDGAELSELVSCSGNVMTLLDHARPPDSVGENAFRCLFRDCEQLTIDPAHPLTLPATTLALGCYESMFEGCAR